MSRTNLTKKIAVLALLAAAAWLILSPKGDEAVPALPENFFAALGAGRMYDYRITTEVDYSGGEDQRAAMKQDLSGVLHVKLLEMNGGDATLAMQFNPISIAFSTNDVSQPVDPMAETLIRQVFLVEIGGKGNFKSFTFPPDIPENLTTMLEGALRSVQLILPPTAIETGGNASWRVMEQDSNGNNVSAYALGGDGAVRKRRLSYDAADERKMRIVIVSSDISGRVDAGWIKNVRGHERNEFFVGASQLAAGTNAFEMDELSFAPEGSGASIWSDKRTAEQIRSWFAAQRARERGDRKLAESVAAGETQEGRRARLRSELAIYLGSGIAENRARFNELIAFLKDNPDAAKMLPELVLGITDDDLNNHLILALQLCGTPEAQEALCSFMTDARHNRMNALRAIMSFSFVEAPTAQSIETLKQMADSPVAEYANTALLAIGGSASKLRESDPGRYPALAEELRARLAAAQENPDYGAERTALYAIGNAGDASFIKQIEPYLTGSDAAYRTVAAETLRHMRGPEVYALLTDRIKEDPAVDVRRAAAKSLTEQPPDNETIAYVSSAIFAEPDGAVATDMAVYLGRAAKEDPAAKETLEKLWDSTNNRDVLRVIRDVRRGRTP